MLDTELLKWIKELGLPVVALYYLFRLYKDSLLKGTEIADKYAQITLDSMKTLEHLIAAIDTMTTACEQQTHASQVAIDKLINIILQEQHSQERRKQDKRDT